MLFHMEGHVVATYFLLFPHLSKGRIALFTVVYLMCITMSDS